MSLLLICKQIDLRLDLERQRKGPVFCCGALHAELKAALSNWNERLAASAPELYGVLHAIRVCLKFGNPIPEDYVDRIDEVLKQAEPGG